jgi:aspartyl protease family protein
MIKGAILFAIAGAALALAALSQVPNLAKAPKPVAIEQRPVVTATAGETEPAKERAPAASGFRETSLGADSKGQYIADALVNGMPVRMMVDTGASFVALSASTAARLELVPGPGDKMRIKTANGETTAAPVMLDALSLGGIYMNDVEALVLAPDAGEVNLLGASFLKRLVSVEQRDGLLILRQ